MNTRILSVLLPLAAIVAFMAVPSLVQASTEAQCAGTECANNATIKAQSSNLKVATQSPAGELSCTSSEFEGTLTENQKETLEGPIAKSVHSNCVANGHTAHIATNAATGWKLQVQQPEGSEAGETPGQVTAHVDPAAGKKLEFTVQIQELGFVVATCTFSASTVQLMGSEQSDTLEVEGKEQFTLTARSGIAAAECGTVNTTKGDLAGSLQFETAGGGAVVVHRI